MRHFTEQAPAELAEAEPAEAGPLETTARPSSSTFRQRMSCAAAQWRLSSSAEWGDACMTHDNVKTWITCLAVHGVCTPR